MSKQKLHESTKKLIVAGITIFVAMILLAVYFLAIVPQPTKGEKNVTLEIVYADKTYEYDIKTNAETMYDMLVEQDEVLDLRAVLTDGPYGKYIASLNGTAEDKSNGYYYTYTVNGEFALLGISSLPVNDGDKIVISYNVYNKDGTESLVAGGSKSMGKNEILLIVFIVVAAALFVYGIVNLAVYATIQYKKLKRKREADKKLEADRQTFDLKHIDIEKDLKQPEDSTEERESDEQK